MFKLIIVSNIIANIGLICFVIVMADKLAKWYADSFKWIGSCLYDAIEGVRLWVEMMLVLLNRLVNIPTIMVEVAGLVFTAAIISVFFYLIIRVVNSGYKQVAKHVFKRDIEFVMMGTVIFLFVHLWLVVIN